MSSHAPGRSSRRPGPTAHCSPCSGSRRRRAATVRAVHARARSESVVMPSARAWSRLHREHVAVLRARRARAARRAASPARLAATCRRGTRAASPSSRDTSRSARSAAPPPTPCAARRPGGPSRGTRRRAAPRRTGTPASGSRRSPGSRRRSPARACAWPSPPSPLASTNSPPTASGSRPSMTCWLSPRSASVFSSREAAFSRRRSVRAVAVQQRGADDRHDVVGADHAACRRAA